MTVRFVGGSLNGETAEQQGWFLEGRFPVVDGFDVYAPDRANGCYRYVRTEPADALKACPSCGHMRMVSS